MNRLINENSAYLRKSASQRIDWYPWSQEAFERARAEDKPVFLSSGAIWCHWCHVMAEESFEDDEIVEILNKNFICIKLDRDERPDIDRRLQLAVQTITGTGGWPLTVFMTPEGQPFFGGTYFPPEDRYGRPGLRRVLKTVLDFYRKNRQEVLEYSSKLMRGLSDNIKITGDIQYSLIEKAGESIISSFDLQNGGFGRAPKFPMPGAIEFVINRLFFEGKENFLKNILYRTLYGMAKGGIHDQIGGGFHRYSTDGAWIIPHFEKLADDNAWILRNYIDAFCLTGEDYFREVAEGIIRFVTTELTDPEGGFYASQDADVTPEDEGGYFTWTYNDLKEVLDERELAVISRHLFHERGSMHHNPEKRVLFIAMEPEEIAEELKINIAEVKEIIKEAKIKLLLARNRRQQPFIDRNLYTSLNGMMIGSFIKAARFLDHAEAGREALRALERILRLRYKEGELFHSEGVKALLDDYIYLAEALLLAHEFTGRKDFLERSIQVMDGAIEKLYDHSSGGFFDTEEPVLGIRLKSVEDIPHPSPNSLAIVVLLKLFHLTDRRDYLRLAEDSLRTFSKRAFEAGIFSCYFFVSLDMYFNMLRLSLYTEDRELRKTALQTFRPLATLHYPEKGMIMLEETGYILPCLRERCLEPVRTKEGLIEFLKEFRQY